jgi:hypothetical protein
MTHNTRRVFTCDHASTSAAAEYMDYGWSGARRGRDIYDTVSNIALAAPTDTEIQTDNTLAHFYEILTAAPKDGLLFKHMNQKDAVYDDNLRRMVLYMRAREDDFTIMKRLCMECPKRTHPCTMLHERGFTSSDMLHMGLAPGMLSPDTFALITDKRIFPVEVLMKKGFRLTITRMLLMGISLQMIAGAKYTHDELKMLLFTKRIGLSAGKTEAELLEMFAIDVNKKNEFGF